MSKQFFEVFPTLRVEEEIKMLFLGVQVLKVTTNSMHTFVKVHLKSDHLIQKTSIYEMEHLIKMQLFKQSHVQVVICETYELSAQYTPENIMKAMEKDSLQLVVQELFDRKIERGTIKISGDRTVSFTPKID